MKKLIEKGLEQSVVKIVESPDEECIVCQIGDYWFYFLEAEEAETKTLEEISSKYNKGELSEMIYEAIRGLGFDEMLYYEHFLMENISLEY